MSLFEAALLGFLQGATEFLPVSSSGHLVLVQTLLGVKRGALSFDICLHLGTLVSVLVVFWKDILNIILLKPAYRHLTLMLIIALIPTGLIGLIFRDTFENIFDSVFLVGLMLLVTGAILWVTELFHKQAKEIKSLRAIDALIIGLIQGIAIVPGISRSGSTMVGGLLRGLKREEAAKFSFFLSIPVIAGASILKSSDILKEVGTAIPFAHIVLGTGVAMVTGYFAIRFLLKLLKDRSLRVFAYYCWVIGLITIVSGLIK